MARRFRETKILWLVHMPTDSIARFHSADLMVKYSFQGLDITEMRAIFAVLPAAFDNDGDGKKAEWREGCVVKVDLHPVLVVGHLISLMVMRLLIRFIRLFSSSKDTARS